MAEMQKTRTAWHGKAAHSVAEICVNFVLPYVIYVRTQHRIGQVDALLISSLPPLLWSVGEFFVRRRVDALSLLAIGGIALSLLAFIGGGSVRFLQLRENLVTGLIGLVFLGSAVIGKPLIYELARVTMARQSAAEAEKFKRLRGNPSFETTMRVMTLVWGFGLLAQTAAACALVFALPISTYLLVSPFLGYGSMAVLGLWTFLYAKQRERTGARRRAAQPDTKG